MRNAVLIATAGMAFFGTSGAAWACDLEGFGFTRVNPFGLNSSWGVPQDHQQSQPASADASAQSARQSQPQTAQAKAEDTAADRQRADRSAGTEAGFAPVSQEAAARQSQRFTATKD